MVKEYEKTGIKISNLKVGYLKVDKEKKTILIISNGTVGTKQMAFTSMMFLGNEQIVQMDFFTFQENYQALQSEIQTFMDSFSFEEAKESEVKIPVKEEPKKEEEPKEEKPKKEEALKELVYKKIVDKEVEVTDKEVEEKMKEIQKQFATEEDFAQYLRENGLKTTDDFKREVRYSILYFKFATKNIELI